MYMAFATAKRTHKPISVSALPNFCYLSGLRPAFFGDKHTRNPTGGIPETDAQSRFSLLALRAGLLLPRRQQQHGTFKGHLGWTDVVPVKLV
jgi:hypothetical protein